MQSWRGSAGARGPRGCCGGVCRSSHCGNSLSWPAEAGELTPFDEGAEGKLRTKHRLTPTRWGL